MCFQQLHLLHLAFDLPTPLHFFTLFIVLIFLFSFQVNTPNPKKDLMFCVLELWYSVLGLLFFVGGMFYFNVICWKLVSDTGKLPFAVHLCIPYTYITV